MATQKFIPEITEEETRVGNSLNWTYTYDGKTIRFNNGSIILKKEFPQNRVCCFSANGKDSEISMLRPPKNPLKRFFWEYGFYNGHILDATVNDKGHLEVYGRRYRYGYEYFMERMQDDSAIYLPGININEYGWRENPYSHTVYKDYYRSKTDGRPMIVLFNTRYKDKNYRWFWYDRTVTIEEIREFFKGCPLHKVVY